METPSPTFESGAELLASLTADAENGGNDNEIVLQGMVRESDLEDHVAFARGSCDDGWLDIPADLIGHTTKLDTISCRGHTHPYVRLTVSLDPNDRTQRLLRQALSMPGSRTFPQQLFPDFGAGQSSDIGAGPGISAPAATVTAQGLIWCRPRCIEYSKLFPNVCNRWVWDCVFGPIIILSPGVASMGGE